MPVIVHTDYLLQVSGAGLIAVPGVWVRLLNNSTATNYYSTAVTTSTGAFTHSAVPGDYSAFYGTAATVPGTPTLANAHWAVPVTAGDDAVLGSATLVVSSPYNSTAVAGGADYGAAVRIAGGKPWYDITHPTFAGGAKGIGTDDTTSSQAALTLARTSGGGWVFAPPGIYGFSLGLRTLQSAPQMWAGLIIGPKTKFSGVGRATVFQMMPGQIGNVGRGQPVYAILNYGYDVTNPPVDEGIVLEDLVVDGNAANNATDSYNGIAFMAHFTSLHRVRVQDFRGTAIDGSLGETFLFYFPTGSNYLLTDCQGIQTGAQTVANAFATGPGVTNHKAIGCVALGITIGFGFNDGTGSTNIERENCHAYLCWAGFHIESTYAELSSGSYKYIGCISGGRAADDSPGHFFAFPYTHGKSLGNVAYGYQFFGPTNKISLIGCDAGMNGFEGVYWDNIWESEILGGNYEGNGKAGIHLIGGSSENRISVPRVVGNNTSGQAGAPGSGLYLDAAAGIYGTTICKNNVVMGVRSKNDAIATPVAAPVVTDGGAAGTNLKAGLYTVGMTWSNAEGQETALSPTANVTLALDGNKINVAAITAPRNAKYATFYFTAAPATILLGPAVFSDTNPTTVPVQLGVVPGTVTPSIVSKPLGAGAAPANQTSPQLYGMAQDLACRGQGNLFQGNDCAGNATANTLNILAFEQVQSSTGGLNMAVAQTTITGCSLTVILDVDSLVSFSGVAQVDWTGGTAPGALDDNAIIWGRVDGGNTGAGQSNCVVAAKGKDQVPVAFQAALAAGSHQFDLTAQNTGARGLIASARFALVIVPNLQ